ncbi:MAG: beta-lactamase family protein [Gemmatimonadetes bacterium]|nr:beta-lactamase family protein [Gemmatimonadota bacterium]
MRQISRWRGSVEVGLVGILLAVGASGWGALQRWSSSPDPAGPSADRLIGEWGAEKDFRHLRGTLRLREVDGAWVASIADLRATAIRNGASFTVEFPDERGSFRGALTADGAAIEGHWIQAAGQIEIYRFASPLRLEKTTAGVWEGETRPFDERFGFYFVFRRDETGVVRPLLRNPERNQGIFLGLDAVEVTGQTVRLLDADGEQVLEGWLHSDDSVLSIHFPYRGGTYDFTRRAPHEAPGLYARPHPTSYRYTVPRSDDDGWTTAHASTVGLDADRLAALVREIIDTKADAPRPRLIQGLVVARRGKLVLDEYFYGFHEDEPHDLRSASKSLTGLLVGRAVQEGVVTTDTRVYDVFPESTGHPDPRKADLTVGHLLTMSSGYDCDDNDYGNPGNEDRMQSQSDQPDWLLYTLDLPLSRAPGEAGVYCSGGINLLGGIVARTTGTWLPEFFRTRFAGPMEIDTYLWNLDPIGRGYAGGGLRLRPRDFLKFGQLALDGGRWRGDSVLDRDWIQRSFVARSSINADDDYGYTWWRTEHESNGRAFESWSATGNGGQLLIVVPDFELAVAFTGGSYRDFRTWIRWRDELMPRFIVDAIRD